MRALSVCARKSLLISLAASGLSIEALEKDEHGAPIPVNGVYWSISHKDEYVAGIAAQCPVGIDLERVRPVGRALFNKVCGSDGQYPFLMFQEHPMAVQKNADLFFRIFTAKEAVVKSQGVGLSQLAAVKVTHVVDRFLLEVAFNGVCLPVFQTYWRRHTISLTCASPAIFGRVYDDGFGAGGYADQGHGALSIHPEIRWMTA